MIRKVAAKDINFEKWDATIRKSIGRNPLYAYSWYLKATCQDQWYGLIKGEYTSVAPIPNKWNPKYFKACLRPNFTQQLGFFGQKASEQDFTSLLEHLNTHFTSINYPTPFKPKFLNKLTIFERINMEVDLNNDYVNIQKNYNKSLRKRVRLAKINNVVQESDDIESHIQFYIKSLSDKIRFSQDQILVLRSIIMASYKANMGLILQVRNLTQEQVIASGFFIDDSKYITNIAGGSNKLGKEEFAMHLMLDYLIQGNASKPKILDMEGSDIQGVQDFFRSFGAMKVPYYCIKKSNPFLSKFWNYTL